MALLDIPLDRITEADVQRLIAAGAAESLYIDYKQATYGGKEADHAELLADVSSFANTAGGDLIIVSPRLAAFRTQSCRSPAMPTTSGVGSRISREPGWNPASVTCRREPSHWLRAEL
ncbi:MAG: hypothetical protein WDN04_26255 [Rhodospirillales bacterium]